MRFLALWSFNGDDIKKVIGISQKINEDRKKNPDKYPKIVYPDQATLGTYGGFTVVEGTHEQLMNWRNPFGALMDYEFIPVVDAGEASALSMKT